VHSHVFGTNWTNYEREEVSQRVWHS